MSTEKTAQVVRWLDFPLLPAKSVQMKLFIDDILYAPSFAVFSRTFLEYQVH